MSVWVTLLSFCVFITWGVVWGGGGVWVLSVCGVWGWVFMSPIGREVSVGKRHNPTHLTTGHGGLVGVGRNDYGP